MENTLELKTVNELREYSFLIPAYQRGYRWTTQEVNDLMNDIKEFIPKQIEDSEEKTWYCLQPIVLKKNKDGLFEVIDGQQRLTTIYLVLHYLNQDFVEARRDKLFELSYETRESLTRFLSGLGSEGEQSDDSDSNIDYFHIAQAYKTIEQWFEKKEVENYNKDDFRSKFRFNTKVIWYECFEQDSISVFTRLNIGKISLSNAELIKALFLTSSNFDSAEPRVKQKQIEIANEWDNIERNFQDDKFWYFITGNKQQTNRIEFIFNLMNENPDENDSFSTFRHFNRMVSINDKNSLVDNWKKVKDYYMRFMEWYKSRELYHKIGYLISIDDIDINTLYTNSSKMRKQEFRDYLDSLIKSSLKGVDLSSLSCGEPKDNLKIKKLLLLYNILTMLKNEKDNSLFPFDLYKMDNWDIEHITSVKENRPQQSEARKEWLEDVKLYIDTGIEDADKLKGRIVSCDTSDEQSFNELFEDIVTHFNHYVKVGDDINGLSNLTLLDSNTNRSYKNAVFPMKRKTIIDRDKNGTFIPIGTKNVFLKYFSEYPPKISFWTEEDRVKYDEDLRSVLGDYVEVQ